MSPMVFIPKGRFSYTKSTEVLRLCSKLLVRRFFFVFVFSPTGHYYSEQTHYHYKWFYLFVCFCLFVLFVCLFFVCFYVCVCLFL